MCQNESCLQGTLQKKRDEETKKNYGEETGKKTTAKKPKKTTKKKPEKTTKKKPTKTTKKKPLTNGVNPCSKNNGGCDKLRKCSNVKGKAVCANCPKGYTNLGATKCKKATTATPACDGSKSKALTLWSSTNGGGATRSLPSGFATMQSVTVAKASSYLVLSNFRIRHTTATTSFVAAQLAYPGGGTKKRMIIENYDAPTSHNNFGGSVSWVIKTNGGGSVQAQYRTTDGKGELWINDANGIPEIVAVDLGRMWHKEETVAVDHYRNSDGATGVAKTHLLPKSLATVQSIKVPSAGVYLVISNYRIRVNSDPKTQSFVSAGVSIGGKKSEQRMICENIFTPYKFMNIGGQVSWIVTTTKATTVNIQYRSSTGKEFWFNDSNGVPAATAIRYSDVAGWHKTVAPKGNFFISPSWKDAQVVTIPSPGKYLVLSNYRIRKTSSKKLGFVKARVLLDSGEVGKVKMITDRMQPASKAKNWISIGGMIGWVVNAKTSGKIRVQYYSTVGKDYIMINDDEGNGVPEMQILRLSGCGNANMNKK